MKAFFQDGLGQALMRPTQRPRTLIRCFVTNKTRLGKNLGTGATRWKTTVVCSHACVNDRHGETNVDGVLDATRRSAKDLNRGQHYGNSEIGYNLAHIPKRVTKSGP
jgi:hypothetical protein